MRKNFIIIAACLLSFNSAFAQENYGEPDGTTLESRDQSLKSKRGFEILPQAGDYGLGISATATLDFFANALFGGPTSAGAFAYPNTPSGVFNTSSGLNNQLFLKKFVTAETAYRLRVQGVWTSNTNAFSVAKDELTPDATNPQYVTDHVTNRQMGLLVGAGLEKRRGSHRVQGVYGAEAYIGVFNSSIKNRYGNPFSANFPQPTINSAYNNGARVVKQTYGTGFSFGVRPFIGVEYFFAPKMSLGGEFGYNLGASFAGNRHTVSERWDATSESVVEVKTRDGAAHGFVNYGLSVNNLTGAINLFFYF